MISLSFRGHSLDGFQANLGFMVFLSWVNVLFLLPSRSAIFAEYADICHGPTNQTRLGFQRRKMKSLFTVNSSMLRKKVNRFFETATILQ